jgi:hypothetical protein
MYIERTRLVLGEGEARQNLMIYFFCLRVLLSQNVPNGWYHVMAYSI